MIAAIYARKSTDQNGVSEEEKSVTRQIDHARAYAEKKGWTVSDEHIYTDDGISGAEFVKRPGFMRLMNALKPRPPFQILIMSEESRLGRDLTRTQYAMLEIIEAGVRVFFYLEDQERSMTTATDQLIASIKHFGSAFEREKAGQRTRDALLRKAKAGYVTGCKVYGYDNVEVYGPDGKRSHVIRKINDAEAAIVRRISEEYASTDFGLASIAKQLNAEGVPPPRGHQRGWAPSCIRAILHRPIYRGTIIWGQTQAILRHGTTTSRRRPKSEWLQVKAEELRIISAELWERVHAKIERTKHAFARTSNGTLCGHPSGADLRSTYLLSGIAKCGICGGSLVAFKRAKADGRDLYICVFRHKRGPEICPNNLRMPQTTLDTALLDALNQQFDPGIIAEAVRRALAEIQTGQGTLPEQRLALERQCAAIENRLRHLVEAIATGKATDSIYTELQKEEKAKKAMAIQLDDLDRLTRVVSLDSKRIEESLYDRVADLKGLLGRHIPQTRQMIRKVLDGPVFCTPFTDQRGRGYEIRASGSYAGLFKMPLAVNDGGGEGGI